MTSSRKTENKHSLYKAEMEKAARGKHDHRVELANLPWPEKVRIVVELQKIGNALAKAAGSKPKKVWKI